jgi:uncharacterized membrane protein YczE
MNLYSGLGMYPWGVLHIGVVNHTILTFGQVSQVLGFIIIIIAWLLGFPPGFNTLINMYFIGYFIDLIMGWNILYTPESLPGRFILLFVSIIILGLGSLFYLRTKLGAGPRDGLMLGLVRKTDRPVSQVKGVLEVSVLTIGYFLGGPVGIGTLIMATTVGYSIQLFFKMGGYDGKSKHMTFPQLYNFLQGKEIE